MNTTVNHFTFQIRNEKHNFIFLKVNIELEASRDSVRDSIFVCTLDVSGSMSLTSTYSTSTDLEAAKFSRWDLVKHSLTTIIHSLRPNDMVSLNCFSNHAKMILPLTRMDEFGKQQALTSLESVNPLGGTNLWEGLESSMVFFFFFFFFFKIIFTLKQRIKFHRSPKEWMQM